MGDTLGVTRQAVSAWERGVAAPGQYQRVLLEKIERELDRRQAREREQFVSSITGLAAGAGIGVLLSSLFSDSNSGEGEDAEED